MPGKACDSVFLSFSENADKNEITLGCFPLQTTKGYFCSDLNSSFISLYPHFLLDASIFLKSFINGYRRSISN
jgi:hypothetical protein